MKQYKLPACYGLNDDQKLKKCQKLDHGDFDQVCQVLCVSINEYTHHPDPDEMRKIPMLFFENYPSQMFKNKEGTAYDEASSVVSNML